MDRDMLTKKSHNFAIASLIMGIASIVMCGLLWAILGLCFAKTSNTAALQAQKEFESMAKAGKILSIIGLVFSIIFIVIMIIVIITSAAMLSVIG